MEDRTIQVMDHIEDKKHGKLVKEINDACRLTLSFEFT